MGVEDIIGFLEKRGGKKGALVCHQRPDGDALGSGLALALALRENGFGADVVNAFPLPENLAFLGGEGIVVRKDAADWHREYDFLGVLDCGEVKRLEPINRAAAGALPAFTVDHHVSSAGVGEAIWVQPGASSTGEMIVNLYRVAGWKMGRQAAQALWTAIVTDTGRYSYENATPAALEAGRECLLAGANPVLTASMIYQFVSPGERLLQARALSRVEYFDGGRMAVSWLNDDDFREAGVSADADIEIVNLLRDTTGVEAALFFYQLSTRSTAAPGAVKISIRTAAPHEAVGVAKMFQGGGHARAAGCTVDRPLPAAMQMVTAAARGEFFGTAGTS